MKKTSQKILSVILLLSVLLGAFSIVSFASDKDSLKKEDGIWYYMRDGEKDDTYTGLVKYYDTWYYVKDGVLDWEYTGLTKYYGTWYYVEKGILNWDYTGLTKYYGTWYYVEKGILNWDYTGLTKYYGTWYYVEKGILNWDYTGLTKYYGTWYYVEKGILNWDYTGLTKYYDTWYYVEKGILNWDYIGLTKYYDTWYYVWKGILDWSAETLTDYYGTWYYVYGGILRWDANTLVKYGNDWYVVSGGIVDFNFNGAYVYGDTLNAIDGGIWNKNYNGPIYYDGNAYTLTNGTLYSYYLHPQAVNHDAPYLIAVDRTNNCITVYGKDYRGKFTVPDRAFVCSVGTDGLTPVGVFNTPAKYRWKELKGNVYGQYSTRIVGKVLFHSVPYSKQDNSTLIYKSYNKLGSAASHGCVRLTTADAKWIYDCCPLGTTVIIYDSWGKTVLPKPTAVKISSSDGRRGWDPTDPDPANPWRR